MPTPSPAAPGRRFDLLFWLSVPSALILLIVVGVWVRSYYVSDRWQRIRETEHTSYVSGCGGVEYGVVHWTKPDRDLTDGWQHDSFAPMPTWRKQPFGGGPWKHNFLGFQYVTMKPPAQFKEVPGGEGPMINTGGQTMGGAVQGEVTAVQERLRIPYWPFAVPFAILPAIWLVRWQVRKYRDASATMARA